MKNIIITGANSGIGLVATKRLCGEGHHVIMACRNKERAEAAITIVKKENPKAEVTFMELDLASLKSVRKFVNDFHQKSLSLHVLVNNAGLFFAMDDKERRTTEDGFEMTMGANTLGHFLLTHLLLDDLKKIASTEGEARIVNVVSSLHDTETAKMGKKYDIHPIDFEDFMLEKEKAYNSMQAYKNSKAAMVMSTKTLSDKLVGTGVIINSLCPGFIPRTGLTRHSGAGTRFVLNYFLDGFLKIFKKITRSPEEGGASIVFLATGDEVKCKSGGYYSYDKLCDSSEETCDRERQTKSWEMCTKLVGLDGENTD